VSTPGVDIRSTMPDVGYLAMDDASLQHTALDLVCALRLRATTQGGDGWMPTKSVVMPLAMRRRWPG